MRDEKSKEKTEIVRGLVTEFAEILLKIIKLAHSTYYYHLKQLDQTDKSQTIKAEIQAIFTEYKELWLSSHHSRIEKRGFMVNHKKVQRLMKALGLSAPDSSCHSIHTGERLV